MKVLKIEDLKVGMMLKEDRFEVIVISVSETNFEVQYTSGACFTYTQSDLDNGSIETFIG